MAAMFMHAGAQREWELSSFGMQSWRVGLFITELLDPHRDYKLNLS
jgi:hypothetical protein